MKIEDDIVTTLNSNNTIDKIQNSLRSISKIRRGENRTLVYLVNTILEKFYLPYQYDEPLKILKNNKISERNYKLAL